MVSDDVKAVAEHTSTAAVSAAPALATTRAQLGAMTVYAQDCLSVYAMSPPSHVAVTVDPSGQAFVFVLGTPLAHTVVNTEAAALPLE